MGRLELTLYLLAFTLAVGSTIFHFYKLPSFWILVSALGSTEFYMAVLPVVYHSLPRVTALGLGLSLLISTTTTGFLKDTLRLPRPPEELWLVRAEGYGFPSGHATGSSAFWGYLSLVRPIIPLIAFTSVMVVSVSISRIELGVHYPRDVVGGVVVGMVTAILCYAGVRKLGERSLALVGLIVGLAGLTLYALGLGSMEPPSVLLGLSLAELASPRFGLTGSPGWLYGVLGSIVALALGLTALRLADWEPVVSTALLVLAGFLAVIAPRLVFRVRGGGFGV